MISMSVQVEVTVAAITPCVKILLVPLNVFVIQDTA